MNKRSDFCLDNLFNETVDYIDYSFKVYRQIYDLPEINYTGNVSRELFDYAKKRKYFILLAIYDEEGKIFLERNIQEELYWSLPGGSILKNEDFHSAIKRIASRIMGSGKTEICLGEIEPMAFVTNRFDYNNESFEHYGIAFAARIRNKEDLDLADSLGNFIYVNEKELERINRYANREVARLCHKRISSFVTDFPEIEIATNEKYKLRYLIHNKIVKKYFLTAKLKKKEQFFKLLSDKFGQASSLIDVSCGDSDLLEKLADKKDFDYLVGNDVSWGQINQENKSKKIIFTNHNAAYLPFKDDSFDALYCGNTLHHMNSREELKLLFENCFKVAKKCIFLEIENPSETGGFPYFLNKFWYGKFLNDAGSNYFNKKTFQAVINSYFHEKAEIKFEEFKNVQGRYLLAEVVKNDVKAERPDTYIEVEEKFYLSEAPGKLIAKITAAGYIQNEDEYEVDEYFTDHEGEFVKNRTCLRIRTKQNQSEITFKGKSQVLSGFYAKAEHNLPLPVAVVPEYKKLFNSLGYYKYVTVAKRRQNFSLQERDLIYNIAIDAVENVGAFAELEILAPSRSWRGREEALKEEMKAWIEKLSAQDWQKANLPYRDFTALSIKEKILKAPTLKALLLDFDGTIVPSEELFFRAFREAVAKYFNYQLSAEEYKEKELHDSEGLFLYLSKQTDNYKVSKEDLMMEVYDNYDRYFNALLADENSLTNLRAFKDLKNIGYKLALVTASKRQFVERLLKAADASDLFDVLIAREDVSEKKPSPAGFNLALERLSLRSEECLIIEDSPRGIVAAKAAGVDCVGVYENSLINKEELEALNIPVFEGVKEIIYILRYAK